MKESEIYALISHIIGYAQQRFQLIFWGRADIVGNDWVIELITITHDQKLVRLKHNIDLINEYEILDELVEKIDQTARILTNRK